MQIKVQLKYKFGLWVAVGNKLSSSNLLKF